jgi:homoserine O-succinyltransferase
VFLSGDVPHVCVADLMARTARGAGGARFVRLLRSAPTGVVVTTVDLDPTTGSPAVMGAAADWHAIRTADAVVVTGAEPRCPNLVHEPGYRLVERIITACHGPVLFSCLAAHAALGVLYGVPRRRLSLKRCGVYRHAVAPDAGALATGLPGGLPMPHSRHNTARTADLRVVGVRPILTTMDGDWALATGTRYTFVQAHPEYEADTLLREYRRDVRRFLRGESDVYPPLPVGCVSGERLALLAEFGRLAVRRRTPETFGWFPEPEHADQPAPWSGVAARIMANWLTAALRVPSHT